MPNKIKCDKCCIFGPKDGRPLPFKPGTCVKCGARGRWAGHVPEDIEVRRERAKHIRWIQYNVEGRRSPSQASTKPKKNPNRDRSKEQAARRKSRRAFCLAASTRCRCRKRGIAFGLTRQDVEQLQQVIDAGHCEVTGARFEFGTHGPRTPTLDRIKPALGYVSGNVRVVCFAINAGMGNWGEDALFEIVKEWVTGKRGISPQRKPRGRSDDSQLAIASV